MTAPRNSSLAVLTALVLAAAACGGGGSTTGTTTPTTPVTPTPTVAVSVTPGTLSLAVAQSQQLTAAVTGSTNLSVTWSSTASSVATVSGAGLVSAIAPGTATITATSTADPTKSASSVVTVTGATSALPNHTLLTSGNTVIGISGFAGSRAFYRILVPQGTARLVVETNSGLGDLDLMLRAGQPADTMRADCGSGGATTVERCIIHNPAPGEWSILLHGYAPFANTSLTATTFSTATPGYMLSLPNGAITLTQGTSVTVPVTVTRVGGYNDPIALSFNTGGAGVNIVASPLVIPAGSSSSTLTVTATSTATLRNRGFWVFGAAGTDAFGVVVPFVVRAP